ncbi:MAG: GNAT family N-acetyltransferase [Rickettsiales bacterium]
MPDAADARKLFAHIQAVETLSPADLSELCEATEQAVLDVRNGFTVGLHRSEPLARGRLESYWKGVLMVPERVLIIGRIDGVIGGAIQFLRPSPINQTSSFAALVENHFVVNWARGHGLAKDLLAFCEREAQEYGLGVLRASVRADMQDAIEAYEERGFICWGTLDAYEKLDGKVLPGKFYYKVLDRSLL